MQRKTLSADGMLGILRKSFQLVDDPRGPKAKINTTDALMTALSAFSFKFDSFQTFYDRLQAPNDTLNATIGKLYKIEDVPSPTRIKEIIDPLPFEQIAIGFKDILREMQRGKVLESYRFWDGHYLVAGDGTQYFQSKKIHCKRCLVKNHKNGETSYSHQMYAGCIIHPALKPVVPLAPEPIQNDDGSTKNDCERNASGRFLEKLRKDHPKMKFIITEDGLSSNAPHIRKIQSLGMKFILGARPGDHKYLFDWVNSLGDEKREVERSSSSGKRVIRRKIQRIRYVNDIPLNDANRDMKVNFLELEEIIERKVEKIEHDNRGMPTISYNWKREKTTKFSWVTDIKLTDGNVFTIMAGGRKRWSIENETFNTLKNMGYNWEHNYGHGEDNLATNFALLMMLAFMIDQVQELCCPLFQKVLKKLSNCKKYLWDRIRGCFILDDWIGGQINSWKNFFNLILYGKKALDTG